MSFSEIPEIAYSDIFFQTVTHPRQGPVIIHSIETNDETPEFKPDFCTVKTKIGTNHHTQIEVLL